MTVLNPLVVLDADSTALQDEVIELIAEVAGTRDEVAKITERAMRGEIDFADSLRHRVRTLAGTPREAFVEIIGRVQATEGLKALADEVHKRNGVIGVVSGGFHEVLDEILPQYDIDIWVANRLEVIDEKLTGELYGPLIDAEGKAQTLRHWSQMTGIPLERSIAVGDGANDLAMMAIAGTSIAFNAKPIVREKATYAIDVPDLSPVIAYLDGPSPTS